MFNDLWVDSPSPLQIAAVSDFGRRGLHDRHRSNTHQPPRHKNKHTTAERQCEKMAQFHYELHPTSETICLAPSALQLGGADLLTMTPTAVDLWGLRTSAKRTDCGTQRINSKVRLGCHSESAGSDLTVWVRDCVCWFEGRRIAYRKSVLRYRATS